MQFQAVSYRCQNIDDPTETQNALLHIRLFFFSSFNACDRPNELNQPFFAFYKSLNSLSWGFQFSLYEKNKSYVLQKMY